MSLPRLALAAACLLLSACSSAPPPSPAAPAAAPPPAAAPASAAPLPPSGEAPAPRLDGLPELEDWAKPGVDEEQRRRDVEQCYAYAQGVMERNRQIEYDRMSGYYDTDPANPIRVFRRQMSQYESRNILRDSYMSCMRSRGYERP